MRWRVPGYLPKWRRENILFRLKEKGLRGVGLKLGGKGAALLWKGRQFLSDPFPVETVDTTGAGDCFNAGFIFAPFPRL